MLFMMVPKRRCHSALRIRIKLTFNSVLGGAIVEGNNSKAPLCYHASFISSGQRTKNILRIVGTGNLPADHESLFWLNIKSIPSVEKRDNTLQLAIKTRIKLIYRPEALKGVSPRRSQTNSSGKQGNKLAC